MNDETQRIYDFESDWKPCNHGGDKRLYFVNEKRPSLFRIIDMEKQSIRFSDIDRIGKIVDINKVLVGESDSEKLKKLYWAQCNAVLDDIEPITMPYDVGQLTCYIEAFPGYEKYDDILGVLYFKENYGDENMIKAQRFFRIHPIGSLGHQFEEINDKIYNELKFKWMNGDSNEKTK